MAYNKPKKRKFEEREYLTLDGKKVPYKVYFIEGRDTPAIEEGEILALAGKAGVHSIQISKPIQAFNDVMFYVGAQFTKYGMPTIEDRQGNSKPNPTYTPNANRYVAYVSCVGADGHMYEDGASAAPDNVDMLKNYSPEMAFKRARVRAVILALGLKGLNADIEFSDADSIAEVKEKDDAELVAKKKEALKGIQALFTELGISDANDEEALNTKKTLITECFGEFLPPNKMTLDDFKKLSAFLTKKSKDK
jgi:hypothetical protein